MHYADESIKDGDISVCNNKLDSKNDFYKGKESNLVTEYDDWMVV